MSIVHSYSALKLFEQCGLRYYRQRILKDAHETDTTHIKYGNEVHKAIENNIKHQTPLPKELGVIQPAVAAVRKAAGSSPVQVERNMGLDSVFNPTDYWGSNIYLRAKLDVIVEGEKEATVIDWKTGKRNIDFTQLAISALVVLKTYVNISKVNTAFIWLKDSKMDRKDYNRDDIPVLIDMVKPRLDVIEEAAASNVWTPKPSYLCNYCPCKPTCSYALR